MAHFVLMNAPPPRSSCEEDFTTLEERNKKEQKN